MVSTQSQKIKGNQLGGTARAWAWKVLNRVEQQGAWAEKILSSPLSAPTCSEPDRRLARELVLGVIKARAYLDYVLRSCYRSSRSPGTRIQNLLRLGAYQLFMLSRIPAYAAVHATVALAKTTLPPAKVSFVNAVLRSLARQGAPPLPDPSQSPLDYYALRYSLPTFIVERWLERWGEILASAMMAAANETPPLVVRVNRLRGNRTQGQILLSQAGIKTQLGVAPDALTILPPYQDPVQWPGWAEGWWYLQDQASQWISYIVDPQASNQCLDLCAAPGGKATHLAEMLAGSGQVFAFDQHPGKLKQITANAQRLQLNNLTVLSCLPAGKTYDRVLVDAPCSGWGTLRRHAEIRWRVQAQDSQRLAQNQLQLLQQAADYVKPGGYLIYSTCTTEPEENQDVVQAFLSQQKKFVLAPGPAASGWPDKHFWQADGYFRTFPHDLAMDAMFAARLKKES